MADATAEANVTLSVGGSPETMTANATGESSFSAIISAIKQLVPHEDELAFVRLNGLSTSDNTQTKVTVQLGNGTRDLIGEGSGSDPNMACVRAYVHALNQRLYDDSSSSNNDGGSSRDSAAS